MRTSQKRILAIVITFVLIAAIILGIKYNAFRYQSELQKSKSDLQTSVTSTTTEYLQSYINSGSIESMLSDELQKVLTDDQVKEILDKVTKAADKTITAQINDLKEATLTEAQFNSLKAAISAEILSQTNLLTQEDADSISKKILEEVEKKMKENYLTTEDLEALNRNSSDATSKTDTNDINNSVSNLDSTIKSVDSDLSSLTDQHKTDIDSIKSELDQISKELSDINTDSQTSSDSISNLKDKLERLGTELSSLSSDTETSANDIVNLKEKYETLLLQFQQLTAELTDLATSGVAITEYDSQSHTLYIKTR